MFLKAPAAHSRVVRVVQGSRDLRSALTTAFAMLGWEICDAEQGVAAKSGANFWSWGELITVCDVGDGHLTVESRCRLPTQVIDWGKNRRNVDALLAALALTGITTAERV